MARDSSGSKNQPQYSSSGVSSQAADLSEVANYAAANGNRKAGTSTQRTNLSGADLWDGLEFYETDTGATWLYKATSWVRRQEVVLGRNRLAAAIAAVAATGSWTDVCTVTATTTGGTCMAEWSAIAFNNASSGNRTVTFQVLCDGALVEGTFGYDVPVTNTPTNGSTGSQGFGEVESALAAGSHTWKLQASASTGAAVGVRAGAVLKITEV